MPSQFGNGYAGPRKNSKSGGSFRFRLEFTFLAGPRQRRQRSAIVEDEQRNGGGRFGEGCVVTNWSGYGGTQAESGLTLITDGYCVCKVDAYRYASSQLFKSLRRVVHFDDDPGNEDCDDGNSGVKGIGIKVLGGTSSIGLSRRGNGWLAIMLAEILEAAKTSALKGNTILKSDKVKTEDAEYLLKREAPYPKHLVLKQVANPDAM
ncbi:hypothetical protein HPP92_028301 [Vanilla planifolia]|uniref:Uncharacterized protein n=1 Tax=Vanilla planifolia TaxID=51239 RepID=A0A835U4H6_VANPL|nr:hypothetical protein HPP92_028301 [Vanilla planifolia]